MSSIEGASLLVLQPSSQRYATSLPTNIGEQRVFLSVFELVAVMTVCADDFMASRLARRVALDGAEVLGALSLLGKACRRPNLSRSQRSRCFILRTKTVVHAREVVR
jgi:hypothetical protein